MISIFDSFFDFIFNQNETDNFSSKIIKNSFDFDKKKEHSSYSSTIKIHINECKEDAKLDQLNNNKNLNQEVMNIKNDIATIQDSVSEMKQEISIFKDNFAEIKHGLSYIYGKKTMSKVFVKTEIKG